MCRFSLPGILQDIAASMIIDKTPLFNLLQGSKAAETDEVIVQAAISDARRLGGAVGMGHICAGWQPRAERSMAMAAYAMTAVTAQRISVR
jgi:hypothetical protein